MYLWTQVHSASLFVFAALHVRSCRIRWSACCEVHTFVNSFCVRCVSVCFRSIECALVPYSRTDDFQLERAEARQVDGNCGLLWEVNPKIAMAVKLMKTMKTITDNHSFLAEIHENHTFLIKTYIYIYILYIVLYIYNYCVVYIYIYIYI